MALQMVAAAAGVGGDAGPIAVWPAMSALEASLLEQIAAAGLPAPLTEFKFRSERLWTKHKKPRLRLWRFDLTWPRYRLVVEIDGATWANGRHNRGAGYESDCEKTGEAAERDWTVVRFTGAMVRDGRAIDRIRRIIVHRQQVRWICVDQEVCLIGRDDAKGGING